MSSNDDDDKKKEKNRKGHKERSKSKDRKLDKLYERRLYDISLDDKEFSLKVEVDKKYLRFTAHEINEVYNHVYKNKYELIQIIKKLNLVQSKYTSFSKLIKFIDTAYSKNKISLEQRTEDDLYIIFEVPVDFEEEKYSLHLKKKKLEDAEVLPMLMDQINRLNNNNAIVKNKFNEIEKQINTISRKSSAKHGSAKTNINKELDIIKQQLNDINGKLFGSKKMNNKYYDRNINDKNIMLKSSKNRNTIKDYNNIDYNNKFFKSQRLDMKNKENLYLNKDSNKKYNNNQRYEDKNEDEKEESSGMYMSNNKEKRRNQENNIQRSIKRSAQRENELKMSSRYLNNKEEQKFDENEIIPMKNKPSIRYKKEKEGMIINNDFYNEDNSNEENNINDEEINNNRLYGRKKLSENSNSNEEIEESEKEKLPKVTFINKNLSELEDFKNKTKNEYSSVPIKLKYRNDICKTNTSCGWNDMFEVYISYKDNRDYLASPNCNTFNIDIYSLDDNKKEATLKGHKNSIRTIRYFFYKDKKEENEIDHEYLISADDNKIVIVWDIINNYDKKLKIDTNYEDDIYSCAIFFNRNTERNYIVTSTYSTSSDITNSATKLFSLTTGEYAYYIKGSNFDNIYYLLIWYNQKDKQNYLIQFSYKKILINNLEKGKDELYAKLVHEPENEHYSGYIFSKDNSDLLCTTCYNGFIHVWDLYNKKLVNIIDTKIIMCHIVQWNEQYAIAADFENKSFVIIDLEEKKVYNEIKAEHTMEVKCVKKIMHSQYGESLITSGRDNEVKVWVL